MQTVTMEITVPKDMFSLGLTKEQIDHQVGKWLVISLFRSGRVSSGKAGTLLGISRKEFLELLDQGGIADLEYSQEELAEEFAAVRELSAAEDPE